MLIVVLVGVAGAVIVVGVLAVMMQAFRRASGEWQEVQAKAWEPEAAPGWPPPEPPAAGSPGAGPRSAGPASNDRPEDNMRSGPAPPHHVVRFDLHLLFAEVRDGQLLLDGLADRIDAGGHVSGVPCSLVLEADDTPAEPSAAGLLASTGQGHCELEIDLGMGRAAVRLPTGRGAVEIPVRAASGLPSLF